MKITIVTCYESNEERASFVFSSCKKRGYEVSVITSDYSHIKKQKRNISNKDYYYIDTLPYSKNLSFGRIKSHIKFAKDSFKLVEKQKPDLIWLMIPANTLLKQAKKYKLKHKDVKIVVDVIDMWPESLPINVNKTVIPFSIWKNLRKNNLTCADKLVTECDLYQCILETEYNGPISTIRWCKDIDKLNNRIILNKEKLSLVYIGSINNIISSKLIIKVIDSFNVPVELHIIGEGENRYYFINSIRKHCEVIYHGAIRDYSILSNILSNCHAGINIYRENLYIGLTVKCLDYLANGLPIINNIKGDTWDMVENYNLGINYECGNDLDAEKIIGLRTNYKNIIDFYQNNFTKDVFTKKCLEVIDEVIK